MRTMTAGGEGYWLIGDFRGGVPEHDQIRETTQYVQTDEERNEDDQS
jgi:hypothetical protein